MPVNSVTVRLVSAIAQLMSVIPRLLNGNAAVERNDAIAQRDKYKALTDELLRLAKSNALAQAVKNTPTKLTCLMKLSLKPPLMIYANRCRKKHARLHTPQQTKETW